MMFLYFLGFWNVSLQSLFGEPWTTPYPFILSSFFICFYIISWVNRIICIVLLNSIISLNVSGVVQTHAHTPSHNHSQSHTITHNSRNVGQIFPVFVLFYLQIYLILCLVILDGKYTVRKYLVIFLSNEGKSNEGAAI